jgi:hypothetical protein
MALWQTIITNGHMASPDAVFATPVNNGRLVAAAKQQEQDLMLMC